MAATAGQYTAMYRGQEVTVIYDNAKDYPTTVNVAGVGWTKRSEVWRKKTPDEIRAEQKARHA